MCLFWYSPGSTFADFFIPKSMLICFLKSSKAKFENCKLACGSFKGSQGAQNGMLEQSIGNHSTRAPRARWRIFLLQGVYKYMCTQYSFVIRRASTNQKCNEIEMLHCWGSGRLEKVEVPFVA